MLRRRQSNHDDGEERRDATLTMVSGYCSRSRSLGMQGRMMLILLLSSSLPETVWAFQPPLVTTTSTSKQSTMPLKAGGGAGGGGASVATMPAPSRRRRMLGRLLRDPAASVSTDNDGERGSRSAPLRRRRQQHGDVNSVPGNDGTTTAVHHEAVYRRLKEEWAAKYTSVDALRNTFGRNRNDLWGDLDPGTARRVYQTLLPRALLELHVEVGLQAADLAPLAYAARSAAKLYVRDRCIVPARLAANLYDGFRQWKQYGSFNVKGMSYQQIWDKYHRQVSSSDSSADEGDSRICDNEAAGDDGGGDVLAHQISVKILEKSCKTNDMVDEICLSGQESDQAIRLLEEISDQLERDVRRLLQPDFDDDDDEAAECDGGDGTSRRSRNADSRRRRMMNGKMYRTLKLVARIKRRLQDEIAGSRNASVVRRKLTEECGSVDDNDRENMDDDNRYSSRLPQRQRRRRPSLSLQRPALWVDRKR